MDDMDDIIEQIKESVRRNDAPAVRRLLDANPELKLKINDPVDCFDSPVVIHAQSREMLDVLLDAGADINARSRWWAGSFGLLDSAEPELAAYTILCFVT